MVSSKKGAFRYASLSRLRVGLDKIILGKISDGTYDDEVENYIFDISPEEMIKILCDEVYGFIDALLTFMHIDDFHTQYVVDKIGSAYKSCCGGKIELFDPISDFAQRVIKDGFTLETNESAAEMLRYAANDIGSTYAQHLSEELIEYGLEPSIDDILCP